MREPPYEVVAIDPVTVAGPFDGLRLMSPYVWGAPATGLSMLVRVVDEDSGNTGAIWLAQGRDLAFAAGGAPLLAPGPGDLDVGGCEDPTVVHVPDGCLVYYTGVHADRSAQLLYAAGPDIDRIEKCGVAHRSSRTEQNTKEASLAHIGERWRLLFEYSRNDRSCIGTADGVSPVGPWCDEAEPIHRRPDHWDSWHLSTGPLVLDEPEGPLMFYNGADKDARWAIGWARLNPAWTDILARGDAPLIAPPAESGPEGRDMTFAASVVRAGGELWLYFTRNDRSLARAVLRRHRCRSGDAPDISSFGEQGAVR